MYHHTHIYIMSFKTWLEDKKQDVSNLKKDSYGGIVPTDMAAAKKADLITLPPKVQGTNCGNCKHYENHGEHGFCDHKDVQMPVNARQCCIYWDRDDIKRPWGKMSPHHS